MKSGTLSRILVMRTYGNYVRQLAYGVIPPKRLESRTAGCGKTLLAPQGFDGLHVWGKPDLSGHLVCLVGGLSGLFGSSSWSGSTK